MNIQIKKPTASSPQQPNHSQPFLPLSEYNIRILSNNGLPRAHNILVYYNAELEKKIASSAAQRDIFYKRVQTAYPKSSETKLWQYVVLLHLKEAETIDENILIDALRSAFRSDSLDTTYNKAYKLCLQKRSHIEDALPFYKKWHIRTQTENNLSDKEYTLMLLNEILPSLL